jgi:TolB-like protein
LLAFIALLAVALLGDAPLLIGTPSVVVYPLTANDSSVDREANSRIATAIATRIAQAGGVKVIPPSPTVERANYLTDARQAGADYYVTGFVAGLGSGVSMILQLVSVQNGIVIYSTSAQVLTFADAAGQGDIIRSAILRHAGRSVAQIEALPSAVLPTPSSGPGTEADLGKLLGRRNRAAATPAAVAVAATPSPALALVPLSGSADAARRDATLHALATQLEKAGVHATVVAEQAPAQACGAAGKARGVLGGTLDVRTESGILGRSTRATLRLIEHDCAGKIVYDQTVARAAGGSEGAALAAEHAVDAAVGAYLHPTPQKR